MTPETVRIMCPNLTCRKVLAVPAAARGKTVRCRACSTSIRIPMVKAPAAQKADSPGENGKAPGA